MRNPAGNRVRNPADSSVHNPVGRCNRPQERLQPSKARPSKAKLGRSRLQQEACNLPHSLHRAKAQCLRQAKVHSLAHSHPWVAPLAGPTRLPCLP